MDFQSKTTDISDHSEIQSSENNEPLGIQPSSSKIGKIEDINSSDNTSQRNITFEDTNFVEGIVNNLSCGTIQNDQVHRHAELSVKIGCKETEIGNKQINSNELTVDKCNENNEMLHEPLLTNVHSIDMAEPTTSQDNNPSCSYANKSIVSRTDQNKIKRSVSLDRMCIGRGILEKESEDTSDEDSSKRQKLSEARSTERNTTENLSNDTAIFQKTKSKIKQRNYRKRKNVISDNEDSLETSSNQECKGAPIPDVNEENVPSASTARNESSSRNNSLHKNLEICEAGSETTSDGAHLNDGDRGDSTSWTTVSEDELDEEENEAEDKDEDEDKDEEIPHCLKTNKPLPNWCIIPEIINRQIGNNPLFQRRFHGSLHAVERLELIYKLDEHQGCVNSINFNEKGNLLVSGSDDLTIVVWDWAIGKKLHSFPSGHLSNIFQTKWLPLDPENFVVTCARDGLIRLFDIKHGTSRRIASHRGATHKLAVHVETPQTVISVGEDAKVLSTDIRKKPSDKLLSVKDKTGKVQLYSVHSNPCNSNEFCVAGRSRYVSVYDRRKLPTPLYKLCPDHLSENRHVHITCAIYNYNGTEILASYNDEDIYLFDGLQSSSLDYTHRYQGHRNNATVKGVNYFGPKSEYVISGSDCGNIFMWDKNSEAVVQWMAADQQGVVNCLEGHPHIPILATSGLDYDIKIWIPSCEKPPVMDSYFTECVRFNMNKRKQESCPDTFDGQMLWILLRHIRHTERIRSFRTHHMIEDANRSDSYYDNYSGYQFSDSSLDSSSEQSDSHSDDTDDSDNVIRSPS